MGVIWTNFIYTNGENIYLASKQILCILDIFTSTCDKVNTESRRRCFPFGTILYYADALHSVINCPVIKPRSDDLKHFINFLTLVTIKQFHSKSPNALSLMTAGWTTRAWWNKNTIRNFQTSVTRDRGNKGKRERENYIFLNWQPAHALGGCRETYKNLSAMER